MKFCHSFLICRQNLCYYLAKEDFFISITSDAEFVNHLIKENYMLDDSHKLTQEDLKNIETDEETAVSLIKKYAIQYSGKEHYEQLGSSCTMSIVNTVDTVIGSAKYLDGHFVMPDQINVERLVDWFVENKDFDSDKDVITYFMADYIKRKINALYRIIKRNTDTIQEISTTFTIVGNKEARKRYKKEIQKRRKKDLKIIRLDKKDSKPGEGFE